MLHGGDVTEDDLKISHERLDDHRYSKLLMSHAADVGLVAA
jgi:hypothetical protein